MRDSRERIIIPYLPYKTYWEKAKGWSCEGDGNGMGNRRGFIKEGDGNGTGKGGGIIKEGDGNGTGKGRGIIKE